MLVHQVDTFGELISFLQAFGINNLVEGRMRGQVHHLA